MNAHTILLVTAAGYLLGSIPFGYLLVRLFRGSDVRTTGSGNIGATNVARTSPLLGLATLLLDVGKGMAAVGLALSIFQPGRPLGFVAALAVICGHIFPVWLRFRGGKGVATGLGAFVLLTPKAILIVIVVFLAVFAALRWVALASIFAAACLPLAVLLTGECWRASVLLSDARESAAFLIPPACIVVSSALIIAKHHANIRRLMAGTEPKFRLKAK